MPGWGDNDTEFGATDRAVEDFGSGDKEWGGGDKEVSPPDIYSKPAKSLKELGAVTKSDAPGMTFLPSGVVHRAADNRFWVPSLKQWVAKEGNNLILPPGSNAGSPDVTDAYFLSQHSPASGPSVESMSQMAVSHKPYTPPGPSVGEVGRQAQEALLGSDKSLGLGSLDPRAAYAQMGQGFYSDLIAQPLGWAGKAYRGTMKGANAILGPVIGGSEPLGHVEEENLLTKASEWAKKTGAQFQHYAPAGYVPGALGGVERMVPSLLAAKAGPIPGATVFGTQMGNEAMERAKQAGASDAKVVGAGIVGTLAGGGFGILRPGAAPAAEAIAPTLAERAAGAGTTSLMLGGITTGMNAFEKALYDPKKGVLEGVPDSMLTGFILGGFEAKGTPVGEAEATALARFAKEKPEEFAKQYSDVLGPIAKQFNEKSQGAKPEPRTAEAIKADVVEALKNGDTAKLEQLRNEMSALPKAEEPATAPAEEAPAPPPEAPKELVPAKKSDVLAEQQLEPQDIITSLREKRVQLGNDLEQAKAEMERLRQAGRRGKSEEWKEAIARVASATNDVVNADKELSLHTGKTYEELQGEPSGVTPEQMNVPSAEKWANTKSTWEAIKQENRGRVNMNPDPTQAARLITAAVRDGYKNASEWLADLREKMGDKFKDFYTQIGGLEGANKLWAQHGPSEDATFGHRRGLGIFNDYSSPETRGKVEAAIEAAPQEYREFPQVQIAGRDFAKDVSGRHITVDEVNDREGKRAQVLGTVLPNGDIFIHSIENQGLTGSGKPMLKQVANAAMNAFPEVNSKSVFIGNVTGDGEKLFTSFKGGLATGDESGKVATVTLGDVIAHPERGAKGQIADNLGLQQLYEAGMSKAKEKLGLPDTATDGDVVKAIGAKIGELGKTAKETAVKIMSQVKGIGRDLAEAIANHLHEAVSGSRESQLGAIGKEVKVPSKNALHKEMYPEAYAEHQKKMADIRAWIAETFPGEENKQTRIDLRSAMLESFKPPVEPSLTSAAPSRPEVPFLRGGQIRGGVEAVTDVAKAIPEVLSGGGNEDVARLHQEAKDKGVLQELYVKGSNDAPAPAKSTINPEQPKVLQDFSGGTKPGEGQQLVRSGHNIWEKIFGADNPAMNAVLAVAHRVQMGHEYGRFMRDVTKGVKDSSVTVQNQMKPLFQQFLKEKARMDAIEADKPDATSSKESHVRYRAQMDQVQRNIDHIIQQKNEAIRGLAKEHADVRIALAAEMTPDKYPTWLKLSAQEEAKADAIRGFTKKVGKALKDVGIGTLRDDQLYVTHMVGRLMDRNSQSTYDQFRSVLDFKHRQSDTGQWLPSVHAFGDSYIPSATYKLAFQPFLDKWGANGGMLDPKNQNGLVNELSPNKAPGAAEYLSQVLHGMQNPEERGTLTKATDVMRDISNTLLLGFNERVGYKHLVGKATSLLAEHHVWSLPATKGQIETFLANQSRQHPALGQLIKDMGLNKGGMWEKKADLIRHFVVTREVMNTFKDDPFVAQISGSSVPKNLSPTGYKIWKGAQETYRDIRDNPVKAIEYWENGLNVMASLSRAKGMDWNKAVEATMQNVLDYNFRGGADAPQLVKNKIARGFIQFAQTPMKSTELKAKLILNGLRGGQDLYGTNHTAKLVRQVVAYGAVIAAGAKLGVNVTDSLLHMGVINQDVLHHMGKAALGTGKGDWDEVKDRLAALYGISKNEGILPNAPWLAAFAAPIDMVASAYSAEGGVKEKARAAVKDIPGYRQTAPMFGEEVPEPYEGIWQNITGTKPPETQEDKDARQIKRGYKALSKMHKRANQ